MNLTNENNSINRDFPDLQFLVMAMFPQIVRKEDLERLRDTVERTPQIRFTLFPDYQSVKHAKSLEESCHFGCAYDDRDADEALMDDAEVVLFSPDSPSFLQEADEFWDRIREERVWCFVKNPKVPDASQWIETIRFLAERDIQNIAALHSGFFSYVPGKHKNEPKWSHVVELRRVFRDIPILNELGAMSGSPEGYPQLAQKGLDLGMRGVAVPISAGSLDEPAENLSVEHLGRFLALLKPKVDGVQDLSYLDEIRKLRGKIDEVDVQILENIALRQDLADKIGALKAQNSLLTLQSGRWDEILRTRIAKGEAMGLDESCVREVFEALHNISLSRQTK